MRAIVPSRLARAAAPLALLAAVVAFAAGARWNTFAAGGSDSHCYLGQAEMFARGAFVLREPLALAATWSGADLTFAPAGFVPSAVERGASVPICPAGLSLTMMPWLWLGPVREQAAFLVVPALGAWSVWLTFVLGRRLAGAWAGLLSAALLGCAPIFLYQLVQPMSDVPATAWWLAAIVYATGTGRGVGGGAAAAMAILTRPNLAPLAGLVALHLAAAAWQSTGAALRGPARMAVALMAAAPFGAAAAAGIGGVLALQYAVYGSPFQSGYGNPAELFSVAHVAENARLYAGWMLESHGPYLALGLAAPWALERAAAPGGAPASEPRRLAVLLLAVAAATVVAYLPYLVFDAWWYLRFLLPAIPPLVALTGAVVVRGSARLPRAVGVPLVLGGALALGGWWLRTADRRLAFDLQRLERHFIDAGHAATRLPENAVVITVKDSGSVRFHGRRPTLLWESLAPQDFDRALDVLRQQGRRPYVLLEADEVDAFKARFAGHTPVAGLDWPPVIEVGTSIRVFDPDDRARYLSGSAPVARERLRSPVAAARPAR